jgi:hypothetical protein
VNLDDNNTSNFDDDDHINSYYNHEFKYEEREVIEGSKRSKDATRHDPSDNLFLPSLICSELNVSSFGALRSSLEPCVSSVCLLFDFT